MSVLIDLAMNSIGTIRFLSGLFTFSQTNLLLYLTPKPLKKKTSIFETKMIMKFIVHTTSALSSK